MTSYGRIDESPSRDAPTATHQNAVHHTPRWAPLWMSKTVLWAATLIFAALAVSLGVLMWYSIQHDGICNATSDKHYLWTYIPVLCFTIFAFAWGRIEYRFKQMQPWRSMAEGPASASTSVTLDYVTPFNLFAILPALRNKHFTVAIVITISLILKLALVLSTGIFTLQDISMLSNATNIVLKDHIMNGSLGLDFRPAGMAIGIAHFNLSAPSGTTALHAYQQFDGPDKLPGRVETITAEVDVFTSFWRCEPARLDLDTTSSENNVYMGNASSASCSHSTYLQMPGVLYGAPMPKPRVGMGFIGSASTVVFIQDLDCSLLNFASVLIYAGHLEKSGSETIGLGNYSASVCHLSYGVQKQPVTKSRNGTVTISPVSVSSAAQLPGIDSGMLWSSMLTAFGAGNTFLYPGGSAYEQTARWYDPKSQYPTMLGFFNQNLAAAADASDIAPFETALGNLWTTTNAQFAGMYLRAPSNASTIGQAVSTESRLVIRPLSFWLLEASVISMTLLAVALCFMAAPFHLPKDLATVTGLITVLVNSRDLMQYVSGTGASSSKSLSGRLDNHEFYTSTEDDLSRHCFAIRAADRKSDLRNLKNVLLSQPHGSNEWFQPIPATIIYRIAVPVSLAAIIACLEILWRISTSDSGIASVSSDHSYEHLAWTYVPTMTMVILSALVSTLQSNAALLQPYMSLRCTPVTARGTIAQNYLNTTSLPAAVKYKHVGLCLAYVCALASSFLTIAASGLYTAEFISQTSAISLQRIDMFQQQASSESSSVALTSQLIVYGNMSFPTNTFEDLVFARTPASSLSSTLGVNGTMTLSLPSLQGRLNCSDISNDIVRTTSTTLREGFWINNVTQIDLQATAHSCDTYLPVSRTLAFGSAGIPESYPAGWYREQPGNRSIIIPPTQPGVDDAGISYFGYFFRDAVHDVSMNSTCPRNILAFGKTNNRLVEQVTVLACVPYVASLVANVTFAYRPDLQIDENQAPIPNNETTVVYDLDTCHGNGTICSAADPLAGIAGATAATPLSNGTNEKTNFDGFFSALVYGSRGIPARELNGPENRAHLRAAVEHLWGIVMAQSLNTFRTDNVPPNTSNIVGSTAIPGERLLQNETSTRALQGLLGLILLCMLLSFPFLEMRKLLPQSPSSIAAVASLVAGSELLSMLPADAWRRSEKELEKEVFKGYLFSLGWWDDEKTNESRFGIDVGKAE